MWSPAIALIIILTFGKGANAVMRPDLAFEKTGLRNHLLRKDLGEQLRAVGDSLNEFMFTTVPADISTYPYPEASMTSEAAAFAQLTAVFNAVFREASAEQYLLYRNIFYGYEPERVVYDVTSTSRGEGNNPVFWIQYPGEPHFKIHLQKDLGASLVFDSLAKLVALMTVDMQASLIRHLGGIGIYREIHLKVKWVSEIYAGYLLWELAQFLPKDFLRGQVVDLVTRAEGQLIGQLTDLASEDTDFDRFKLWYSRWVQPQSAADYLYADDILNLSLDLLGIHFMNPNMDEWGEADHDRLAARVFQDTKNWWRAVPSGSRFRILHEAHLKKDSILESVIATESIVVRNCDALLTSHH